MDGETVWLSQAQMAELFNATKQNISLHINNIYDEGELEQIATVKDYLTVQKEGKRMVKRHHDRFLIIDDAVYIFGASLKDAGKKLFAYIRMQVNCDGDSDGDGNDLLYGVLIKKSVLEFDFQNA